MNFYKRIKDKRKSYYIITFINKKRNKIYAQSYQENGDWLNFYDENNDLIGISRIDSILSFRFVNKDK